MYSQCLKKICTENQTPKQKLPWKKQLRKHLERMRVKKVFNMCTTGEMIGDVYFRNRIRMYPALVNCTTIDWFSEWPLEALLEVADKYLSEMSLGSEEEVSCLLFRNFPPSLSSLPSSPTPTYSPFSPPLPPLVSSFLPAFGSPPSSIPPSTCPPTPCACWNTDTLLTTRNIQTERFSLG